MIQLVMLFIFVIFVICIILLYKKYIKIKNIVDKEQDKKYSKVKGAIDTNNIKIKNMKKKVKDIINNKENDPSLLDSRVDINKKQISSNRNTIIDNNFETINSVFKYDNGLFIGGTAGHMIINDNNIKLNVQNPAKVRVCNSNNKCSNIITNKIVQDTFPEIISNTSSQQQHVEAAGSMHLSGISGSSLQQTGGSSLQSGSSLPQSGSSLQQVEEQVHDNNILVSEDNNFQFDNNTKVLSIKSGISIMGVEEKNENEITKHSDCNLDELGVNKLIYSISKRSYCTGNLLSNIDNTKNYSFKITEKILTGGKNIYDIGLISDGSKIVEIRNILI